MGLFDAIATEEFPVKQRKKRDSKLLETQEGLEAIMQWAEAAGVSRETVFAQYGGEKDLVKLKEKLAEIIKAKTNLETGEVVLSDDGTISGGVGIPEEDGALQAGNGSPVENNEGVSGGQLVSRDRNKNSSVGDPEVEEMLNDIRRKLRISTGSNTKPSKEMVEGILRERMLHLQELHYLTERFYKLRDTIENRIAGIDRTWRVLLEDWFDENKPEGKKSIELMYGTVGRRNKALSIALDPQNQESFNNWIGAQPEEFKQQYNVKPVTYYKWDWEVYKKTLDETSKVPGTIVTPAQKDVFFIGPSIDTVVEKAKKGKEI